MPRFLFVADGLQDPRYPDKDKRKRVDVLTALFAQVYEHGWSLPPFFNDQSKVSCRELSKQHRKHKYNF